MRRTRYMSLIFLALSLAFFVARDFRWALEVPLWEWRYDRWTKRFLEGGLRDPEPLPVLSEEQFGQLAQAAEHGDASALAFLALHRNSAGFNQRASYAEQAVARDPRLAWVYHFVALDYSDQWSDPPVAARVQPWIAQLENSYPENCVPYLLHAQFVEKRTPDWPKSLSWRKDPDHEFLLRQKEWMEAMDHAFHASRHDDFIFTAFLLERDVLSARGWATPEAFLAIGTALPLANILNTRHYANLQVHYLARKDEQAGRLNQAIQRYYLVSNFSLTLRHSDELLAQLVGVALEKDLAPRMKAALEKAGRKEEATALEVRLRDDLVQALRNPLARNAMPMWLALLVHIFAYAVVASAGLTAISISYVNAKRWVRPEHQGPLFRFMTTLENYAPLVLFGTCLGLFLAYSPYAQNFHYYMTVTGDLRRVQSFSSNVFPFFSTASPFLLQNPFRSYLYWALGFAALASLLAALDKSGSITSKPWLAVSVDSVPHTPASRGLRRPVMKFILVSVLGLVLGFVAGALANDYAVAKPAQQRAAAELEAARLEFARFDPTKCSESRELFKHQVMRQTLRIDQLNRDLDKCHASMKQK